MVTMPLRFCRAKYNYSVDNSTGIVTFTNQSFTAQANYIWSFGDGTYSVDSNTIHTYQSGWYYVCLNLYNTDSSCSDVTCKYILIQKPTPTPCVADFTYEYDSIDSKIVHFSNLTFSDSSISVIWLFPGDGTDTTLQPTYDFQAVGNYKVCLLASGPVCADSVCKIIEVIEILPACDAQFTYQLFADTVEGGSPRIAVFTNQSTGDHLTYEWLVNDSLVSQSKDPVYYYPEDGSYKVCLVARNQQFCSDSTCTMINIVSEPVGLADLSSTGLGLFPNPATTEIVINSGVSAIERIRISNMMGNTVYEGSPEGATATISLANWAKGMYLVEVKTTNQLIRKKLTKL
jgi:PKD repeat protein